LKRWKRDWKIELIERENLNGAISAIYWFSWDVVRVTPIHRRPCESRDP